MFEDFDNLTTEGKVQFLKQVLEAVLRKLAPAEKPVS